ncbi:MAG: hypothetical protein EPN85_04555, partial [Bacteroidetes bacterium]
GVDASISVINTRWRIEKRDLATGALVAGFGTGGIITSNPGAGTDYAYAITADASGIYTAGYGNSSGNYEWRIEKRDLATGALIPGFGTGGVVTSNPSPGSDDVNAIIADASGIYVAGTEAVNGGQWRIEKRDLATGALIAGFGTGGVATSNPSPGGDGLNAIAADASGIYVAGVSSITIFNSQWHIEKHDLITGALLWAQNSNPSAYDDIAHAIAVDAGGVYAGGWDDSTGTIGVYRGRVEKRDLTSGALMSGFGSGGVVITSPGASTARVFGITAQPSGVYVGGSEVSSGKSEGFIEKRNSITGALTCSVAINPSSGGDDVEAITADASGIYVAGLDEVPVNQEWFIEKYNFCGSALTLTASFTGPACSGQCTGTATANPSGGTSPYTYAWAGGQTAQTATGLCAGTYSVTVTDALGVTGMTAISVIQPAALSTSATATSASCGNNNGISTVAASGGSGSYTYGWSTSPVQTTATATGLAGGTYAITVTDANGCTKTTTVSITQTGVPAVTTSSTPQTCTQGGTAAANASGGTSPYTYQWCNGQTASTATGLSAGNCTVMVTDASGCSTANTVTITSSGSIPTATVTSTSATCGNNNGTATVAASGGSGSYTYGWSTSPVQTAATATGLAGGNYTVTVTDAAGCSAIQTVSVTSGSGLNAAITSTQTGCTVNNGTATASVSGGTSPYTYVWNPSGQTASTATGLGSGNYSVTITDASGCAQTQTAVITSVPGPVAVASAASTNITIGNNTSLTATGGGTYSWSPAAGLSCATCANPVAAPSQTTAYCVIVTDGNGCTDSACITIHVEIPCGDIFIPNVFSPNHDGANEMECVLGGCIKDMKFIIYNRLGERVFEYNGAPLPPGVAGVALSLPKWGGPCWDGTYKGKEMNTAVFVYFLEATLTNGEKISRKGNISLIR